MEKRPLSDTASDRIRRRVDRETRVVVGRLAMRSEQLEIARSGMIGSDVTTVENLAARLAGGFLSVVTMTELRRVVSEVVPKTDLGELNSIKTLPGFPSAASSALMRVWRSGIDVSEFSGDERIEAISALDAAVRAVLPSGSLPPDDAVRLALARKESAKAIFGRVRFRGMTELHAVWRKLLSGLLEAGVEVVWDAGASEIPEWLDPAVRIERAEATRPTVSAYSCATARHEAVEALRWARKLLSEGIPASDIAIATVSTPEYDDYLHDLARGFEPGLHFVHGVPVARSREGQACAALADILLRGLSQKRLRRLVALVGYHEGGPFENLNPDWAAPLPVTAGLTSVVRWERAFEPMPGGDEIADVMMPVIRLLDGGVDAAAEAGRILFSAKATKLFATTWERALSNGPPESLDGILLRLREAEDKTDRTSGLDRVAYMPASDLAACPRGHVRLMGLSSRGWPRNWSEDALIPDHVIPAKKLDPFPLSRVDKSDFMTIIRTTGKDLTLSWPRRDMEGRRQGVSSLLDEDVGVLADDLRSAVKNATYLRLHGVPQHAYGESDRLFSRPSEFAATPRGISASACWKAWRANELSGYDGLIAANHPAVAAALSNVQSPTSLRRLLRDPQGFVWKYALGFNAPEYEDEPITLDARQFGNIVHGMLQIAVEALEKHGGLVKATDANIETEVEHAAVAVGMRFEIGQPVPPALIWQASMQKAVNFCVRALKNRFDDLGGQKTFAEVPFGSDRERRTEMPWDVQERFNIPNTGISISGVIDRLDLSADGRMARAIDYKSGRTPNSLNEIQIDGGKELQRVIYEFAVKALLKKVETVESLLYYPSDNAHAGLSDSASTLSRVSGALNLAKEGLANGVSLPGADAFQAFNDMAFALPANARANYLARKKDAFAEALGSATEIWEWE
jgi:hypothetical protein